MPIANFTIKDGKDLTMASTARLARFHPSVLPGIGLRGTTGRAARAYCGPAHGFTWELDAARVAPDDVVLSHGENDFSYRLVHDLRLRRAARDGEGHLLYLPSYEDVLAISALLKRLSLWS